MIEHFAAAGQSYGCREIIHLLRDVHPEWVDLNRAVVRTSAKKKPGT